MSKTKKHKSKNYRTSSIIYKKRKKNNNARKSKSIKVSNTTPVNIRKISSNMKSSTAISSYSPTINKRLITLKTTDRQDFMSCNMEEAFKFKEPLQIWIKGKCYYYYTTEAKKFLLRNLSANKHIDPKKVIPPIQSHSNCWFNAMFVTFFVSDKGRKFFHYLRQLMIEGKQKNGTVIPNNLKNAFALLNFGVEACLTGNEFAYKLNTNAIIQLLYKGIPELYKKKYPYIVDIDEAGNPLLYYTSIINYLNNSSIKLLFVRDANVNWKDTVTELVFKMSYLPHVIVIEIYDENAGEINTKQVSFTVEDAKYNLDSSVVRDISKQHFCACVTCEGKEMGYDGASFHRLSPLKWKNKINSNIDWEFEGSNDYDGTTLKWNFIKSYQLLIYYRVA